ncbi:MAG: DUF2103 domain-containing protein [Patescibacteria group bacterium]
MSNKDSRSGGKYGGNHTTLIHAAATVCDIAESCSAVTRISPGFIKAGLPGVNGKRRIKIVEQSGALLLTVRDNTSHQEVYIYASDLQAVKSILEQGAQKAGFFVSFGVKEERGE